MFLNGVIIPQRRRYSRNKRNDELQYDSEQLINLLWSLRFDNFSIKNICQTKLVIISSVVDEDAFSKIKRMAIWNYYEVFGMGGGGAKPQWVVL